MWETKDAIYRTWARSLQKLERFFGPWCYGGFIQNLIFSSVTPVFGDDLPFLIDSEVLAH